MEPVQTSSKSSTDIATLEQGTNRAQVALDVLKESTLTPDQLKQLEALLRSASPTEGAPSATQSQAGGRFELVDGHQAVVGRITVNGQQLDTLLSEGSSGGICHKVRLPACYPRRASGVCRKSS
jgi:hypothetical protein